MFNMKCPICGNNLYTNSPDNTLVRCGNDDCITCGLDFVRQECFSETKEEIINRCIFIYSERIEDYKRYLRYAVRERNEINNKKDYGCPNCWQIVKPRIYKYIKSYHLIKRTGYFYGCPLCRSSKIINMQNGKQTRQRFVCIAYWYNHICTKIKAKREKQMNRTMLSNRKEKRRARKPLEKVEKPKKVKPVLPVDIENCVYVTLIDKAATSIRKQMKTKAKTSKIIFICESIAEANIIYSLALNRSDFGYVYVCLERPQQFHLTKYAAGVMTYIVGRYHVCLVDKNSSGWTSWYQKNLDSQ